MGPPSIRGETQTALVDTLIDSEWLLRRFRAVDTQLFENAWHVFDITLGKVFTDNCDVFARLQRRIDSTQRHYHNALRELQKLQSRDNLQSRDREGAVPSDPDPEPLPAPTNQTANTENGFVPQILSATPPEASQPRSAGPDTEPQNL
jgi:hypothetical protein